MTKMTTIPENYNNIRAEIVELLKAARCAAARNVNAIMTATYWEIGRRIVESRAGRREASGVWRCAHPAVGKRSLGCVWKRLWAT